MNTPLVSVILATYNWSRYLSEAIESVLTQDYKNLELIIVDDASTNPQVSEIIRHSMIEDTRVRSYRNEKNMERSYSKNLWVREAKWDYIAFIDDDDIWKIGKLSKQIQIVEEDNRVGIVGTYARFIDETGSLLWETTHLRIGGTDIKRNILMSNQFIHSSVMIRRDLFMEIWWFPVDMSLCEDYDLWLRLLEITQWVNIPELLVDYRVRLLSTTARNIYRMKYYSLMLTYRYCNVFPGFSQAFAFRTFSFLINTTALLRIWKKLYRK